jgi:hypothetical protein
MTQMRERLPDPAALAAAFETAHRGLTSTELQAKADQFGRLMELASYAGSVYDYLPSPFAYPTTVPERTTPEDIASDDVRLYGAGSGVDRCKLLARAFDSMAELSPREALDDVGDPYPVDGARYVGVTRRGELVRVTMKYNPVEREWTASGSGLQTHEDLPVCITAWREKFVGAHEGRR